MVIVLATRNHFAIIFTDSPVMQRAVSQLSGLLAITMLLNSIQPVISGTVMSIFSNKVAVSYEPRRYPNVQVLP